jgi:hypothetical protein
MKRYPSLIVAGSLVGMLLPAAAIAVPAASPDAAPSATSIVITTPDVVRIDRQDPPASVTFSGVSTESRQRVDWGDGGAVVSLRGRCTPAKAHRTPAACKVTATHTFTMAGQFTIRAVSGARTATRQVTVAAAPQRWQKPAGWVQPAGWATLTGANFTPCQNVHWYYDAPGLPSDRSTLKADVAQGLALLAAQTGLTFTEVTTAAEAQLIVSVRDLQDMGQGMASVNPSQPGSATVTYNWSDPYTHDVFQGFNRLHLPYIDEQGQAAYLDVNGRGWVVTRLLMMSLGFMFVDDPAQLMHNSYEPAGGFGAGDLDGLHTMYLNLGCPVIPD